MRYSSAKNKKSFECDTHSKVQTTENELTIKFNEGCGVLKKMMENGDEEPPSRCSDPTEKSSLVDDCSAMIQKVPSEGQRKGIVKRNDLSHGSKNETLNGHITSNLSASSSSASLCSTDSSASLSSSPNKTVHLEQPVIFLPVFLPSPRTVTWIRLPQNYWAEDQSELKYVPYFGDDDTTGCDISDYKVQHTKPPCGEVLEVAAYQLLFKFELDDAVRRRLNLPLVNYNSFPTGTPTNYVSVMNSSNIEGPISKSGEKRRLFRRTLDVDKRDNKQDSGCGNDYDSAAEGKN